MARYKKYHYEQGQFVAIQFDRQILPGSFEYTLNYLIDNELDLCLFDLRYKNDDTGSPAYDPAIALSADTRPHFTTIANFISSLDKEIIKLFRDILLQAPLQCLQGVERDNGRL